MTVSIYSLSFGTDVPDDLSISIPDIPTPSIPDINDNEPTGDESDSEVGGTESGVDDEVIDTVSFVIPLEGNGFQKIRHGCACVFRYNEGLPHAQRR